MPPRKAATGASAKAAEPAAKKIRTTRGGAQLVANSDAMASASLANTPMHEDAHQHGTRDMDVDPQLYSRMNGYGGLSEEEMGWAELLKQGYDEQYEKGKMSGYGKQHALSDQVKTIDVSPITRLSIIELIFAIPGQMATVTRIPQRQRSCQAACRFIQLFCRHRAQTDFGSQQPGHIRRRPKILPSVYRYSCRHANTDGSRRRDSGRPTRYTSRMSSPRFHLCRSDCRGH